MIPNPHKLILRGEDFPTDHIHLQIVLGGYELEDLVDGVA